MIGRMANDILYLSHSYSRTASDYTIWIDIAKIVHIEPIYHEIMHSLLRGYCFIFITYHTVGVEKKKINQAYQVSPI